MIQLGRVITAMITPFQDGGAVDYEAAVRLAKHLIEHGSEGILVGGTTGEGATMSEAEKLKLYSLIVDEVGKRAPGKKVPIMGNAGGIDTAASCAFAKKVQETGVDAILAIVPFYVKPTQEGMYRHFKAIAEAVDIPVVLYDVPGRTNTSIAPQTVKRLVDACPNIVGIKDATGNWDHVTQEKILLPDDFLIYSGDDSYTYPILAAGGAGVISVSAHIIGEDMLAMIDAFQKGDREKAFALHKKTYPINKGIFFITSPIPIKTAVNLLGLPGGHFRLPMVPANEEEVAHVKKMLQDYGLL